MPTRWYIYITLIAILFIINLIAFFTYGYDKWRAVRDANKSHSERISEKTLHKYMFFAPLGSALGMFIWRHKTRKWSFKWRAILIFILGSLLYIALFTIIAYLISHLM
ncbi:DUF1294 domain-containing protein [Planctomycetota bacterium]|nr:DUF1294 domain-containing protein [Planctomycetota bacterium]